MLKAYVQLLITLLIKKKTFNFRYSFKGILGLIFPKFDVKTKPWTAMKINWQKVIRGPAPLSNLEQIGIPTNIFSQIFIKAKISYLIIYSRNITFVIQPKITKVIAPATFFILWVFSKALGQWWRKYDVIFTLHLVVLWRGDKVHLDIISSSFRTELRYRLK